MLLNITSLQFYKFLYVKTFELVLYTTYLLYFLFAFIYFFIERSLVFSLQMDELFLYKHIFPVDLEHDTLAVIGMVAVGTFTAKILFFFKLQNKNSKSVNSL